MALKWILELKFQKVLHGRSVHAHGQDTHATFRGAAHLLLFFIFSFAAINHDAFAVDPPVSENWLANAQRSIASREYHITRQPDNAAPEKSAWQAPNRAQNLRTTFTPEGVRLTPRDAAEGATWNVEIRLTSWGRDDRMEMVKPSNAIAPSGNRVDFDRAEIIESYVNDERGLKQDFVIGHAPAGECGSLVLELDMTTSLLPRLMPNGQGFDLLSKGHARPVLRYAGLHVEDAAGKILRAEMILSGNSRSADSTGHIVRLNVEDSEAVYPITIDPLFSTVADATLQSNQASSDMGASVAAAGDVNGDGYGDVIVGAPLFDNGQIDEGAAFLFLGSAAGIASGGAANGVPFESNQAGASFGMSVAGAGDLNADGYADVIIGAPQFDNGQSNEGAAFIFRGSASGIAAGSPATASATLESNQASASFGQSVACAGDVNGDGFSDVIVGATAYTQGEFSEGAGFIFLGSAAGVASSAASAAATILDSNLTVSQMGYSVAGIGDVNGDEFSDVAIGANHFTGGQTNEGAVYIYHGSAEGIASGGPGTASATIVSNQAESEFGSSLAGAGDIDGDGYGDLIVGAPFYNNGESDEGAAFIYLGSATGVTSFTAGTADTILEADNIDSFMGHSVAGAGDVNGDGYADVIVGAWFFFTPDEFEGSAFVYLGSADGIPSGPTDVADVVLSSSQQGAHLGFSVAGAGDVNGDGYADVIVGANAYTSGQTEEGAAFVYQGAAMGIATGSPSTTLTVIESSQVEAHMGYSVDGAGDVNGDGFADIIIGASDYDNGEEDEGAAFIFHGSATGPIVGSPANAATILESNQVGASFGTSVAGAGDVNGDGYSDVIVGAWIFDNGQNNEGAAFIFHGSPTGVADGNPLTAATRLESNEVGAGMGFGVDGAGDVDGDGYADVIVGCFRFDKGQIDEGAAFVFRGSATGVPSGAPTAATITFEGNQADASMGNRVAGAGDVNGDGYADVIVAASSYDKGQTDEGAAFIFLGADGMASGNPATAAATLESNQADANLGISVSGAGDVNGDGYADVIVGAYFYSNGITEEGAAFIFHGSPSGVASGNPTTAATTLDSNQANSLFAFSVSKAGDVNGDGFGDVIVGAPRYNRGLSQEGAAFVFLGSATGVASATALTASAIIEGNQMGAQLGAGVAGAGDVNGDGYADVVIGAYYFDKGQTDEGTTYIFYGNKGRGQAVRPRQRRGSDIAPIAIGGTSDSANFFRLAALGRTPYGRGRVKSQWEVKARVVPFDGTNLQEGSLFTDSGLFGASLNSLVQGLYSGTPYHWRLRLLYRPQIAPFTSFGRWMNQSSDGWNLADLRTSGPAWGGRPFGDFNNSGCTDITDFLIMLDNWQMPYEEEVVGIEDFLNLLDNWQMGPTC